MLRTRDYAGFSLLDIHDYPGQGTALVGFLDPFWDSKELIEPAEHHAYTGATVPLARFAKRTYTMGETADVALDITQFGPDAMEHAEPRWQLASSEGEVLASGTLPAQSIKTGELSWLGTFAVKVPNLPRATKLTLSVSIKDSAYRNSVELVGVSRWQADARPAAGCAGVTSGQRPGPRLPGQDSAAAAQPSAHRCHAERLIQTCLLESVWFDSGPATMGVLVNPAHPLFQMFPTDLHSNWQWLSLVDGSQSVTLDSCPLGYRPLVQVIDDFARNHRLVPSLKPRSAKAGCRCVLCR